MDGGGSTVAPPFPWRSVGALWAISFASTFANWSGPPSHNPRPALVLQLALRSKAAVQLHSDSSTTSAGPGASFENFERTER
jgi:hypothetical protein